MLLFLAPLYMRNRKDKARKGILPGIKYCTWQGGVQLSELELEVHADNWDIFLGSC